MAFLNEKVSMKRFNKFLAVLLSMALLLPVSAYAVFVEDIDEAEKVEHDAVISEEEIEIKIAGASAATSTKAIVIIPGVGGSRLTSGGEIVWVSDETAKLNKLACLESGASQYTVSAMGHEDGVYGPYDTYGFLYRRLSTVFLTNMM